MWRWFLALAIVGIGGSGLSGVAATNTVPGTSMAQHQRPITANDLKPTECASLNLTNVVAGSGTLDGTVANDLILGSSGADTVNGRDGDDCILGGAGDDSLNGHRNNDVILGQAGDDSLDGGQDTDTCDGGGDPADAFLACETTIP